MRKTYRKNNFKELNKQMIVIGTIFIIAVIIGAYLNKIWPNYQNNIIKNLNPAIEYYNNSSMEIKKTIISNLKSDVVFMGKISVLASLVVTFPIAILMFMLKGVSLGYTTNSIILSLKLKSIKMILLTITKNIIIIPGAIILILISFNYVKEMIYELNKGKKDNILFLLKRYLLNVIIVLAVTVLLQLIVNTISVGVIKFLVR
ncbi:stage II sporulation protein M [Romboutsia sp.]|uniref:stage II sporulation protein M n=1 Tax=Romboutsia sp. TaxID=1965302 RepID=UPI003F2AAF46